MHRPPARGVRTTLVLAALLLAACSPPRAFDVPPAPAAAAPRRPAPPARGGWVPVRGEAGGGSALPENGVITLGEVRARTLDKANLRLAAETYREAESRGMVHQAALVPNPFLLLRKRRVSDVDVLGSGFGEVEVGQPLELGHKRRARILQAQAEASTVSERVRALAVLTLHDAEAWFYRLLRLEQDMGVAREAEEAATELEALARRRYDQGKDSRVPVLRFQAAAENARLAVQDVERRHDHACRTMDDLLGYPVGTIRGIRGSWETAKAEEVDREEAHRALATHPRLRTVEREFCAANRRVRRADADAWPNVTVGLMGEYDQGEDRAFSGFSVLVPVPIWNRNEGERVAARAAVGRARKSVEAEALALGVELDQAILDLERATRNVQGFEGSIIPTLDESVSLARKAYEGGKGSYLDVLDALIAWIRARRERLVHLEEQAQATVAIRYLTGAL